MTNKPYDYQEEMQKHLTEKLCDGDFCPDREPKNMEHVLRNFCI